MTKLLQTQIGTQIVFIEADISTSSDGQDALSSPRGFGSEPISVFGSVASKMENTYINAKNVLMFIAEDLAGTINNMDDKLAPSEFTVAFGLKISADGNVILSKVGSEAQFSVTMKCVRVRREEPKL